MLWIRIGFNADTVFFNLIADPDLAAGSNPTQIHADPGPSQTLKM